MKRTKDIFMEEREKMPTKFWDHPYNPITGWIEIQESNIVKEEKKYYR